LNAGLGGKDLVEVAVVNARSEKLRYNKKPESYPASSTHDNENKSYRCLKIPEPQLLHVTSPNNRADSAGLPSFSGRAVRNRVRANPALIHRVGCQLVARIRREAVTIRLVVEAGVDRGHAEHEHIARFELCGQPPSTKFLAQRGRIG